MNVRLVDDVYVDLRSARDWYDEKRDGLGDEFANLFFVIARGLSSGLLHHSIDSTGYRPVKMPRFTAVIYYSITESELLVVGVLVNGRSASAIKNRR